MFDIAVIGGGILGAASALRISERFPRKRIVLLEKENSPAMHQTGRNSGVVHAGVYYEPGSLKARFCQEGLKRLSRYCELHQLPYMQTGKLIVATNSQEVARAEALIERCEQNGLQPEWLDQTKLSQHEASIKGLAAIKVKQTGITDYAAITRKFLAQFEKNEGEILFGHKVTELNESNDSVKVKTHQKTIESDCLVNCAGLYSDVLSGFLTDHAVSSDIQIIPFRGDYYRLPASLNQLINHLIYPVPDPELPFLGVHLTRMIDGSITVGPNAALAFARESYGNTSFNLKELGQSARFPGLWKLLARYPRAALNELRYSWSKTAYLSAVNKYCPQVRKEHLLPYRSGIRAQAVNKNGEMLHDFAFSNTQRTLHLANAPSPAATSSLPIADEVVNRLEHLM